MDHENLELLQQRASLLRAEGKYKETIEVSSHLLECGMELNDHKSVLLAHAFLAVSYYLIGAIEEAFSSIEAHEEYCDKYGSGNDKLHSFNILFLLHEYNKDFEKAKSTLKRCIDMGKKLKYFNIVSGAYSNYSHVCMAEENYVEALEMAKIGLEMAKLHKPSTPILELRVKLNMAKAYIELGDFVNSSDLINEMITNPVLDSFVRDKSNCYQLQGHWYDKQKLYKKAFETYTVAKELAESYGDVKLLKEIQEERCKLCELMNDTHLGYTVQKEYIVLLNEISDREIALTALKLDIKHSISAIEKRANTDYLTGLYNRSYMEETVDKWLDGAAVRNENIICIAIDIDNLKPINDEYGHLFGDEVIIRVSRDCSNAIREDDLMGRFGGDEFAVILKGVSLENGKKKAEELAEIIRNIKIEKDGKTISTTASIGVSESSSNTAMNFKELFNAADMALYEAKQNGKGRICVVQ